MKTFLVLLCSAFYVSGSLAQNPFTNKAQGKIAELKKATQHPLIIEAVSKQNQQKRSLASIQEMDEKWKNASGEPAFIKTFLSNPCAKHLKEVKKTFTYVAELFVMDNQGAIVCESDKTSDYWQGDEAKWKESFNKGQGKDFFDQPKFDESTQAFLMQISYPIFDAQKHTIGAITVGIDLDKLK